MLGPTILALAQTNFLSLPAIAKPRGSIDVERVEAAADVVERQHDLLVLLLHRLVLRAVIGDVDAVIACQRPAGQPLADVVLVARVDVACLRRCR